jgi:hypothetical protein
MHFQLDNLEDNNRKRAQQQKMRDTLEDLSRQVERLHELELEETHITNLRVQAYMQQKALRQRHRDRTESSTNG